MLRLNEFLTAILLGIILFCFPLDITAAESEQVDMQDMIIDTDNSIIEGIIDEIPDSIGDAGGDEFQDIIWNPEPAATGEEDNRWFSLKKLMEKLSVAGYYKNETGFRITSPAAFTKVLNIIQLEPHLSLTSSISLHVRTFSYLDFVYYLENIDTISVRKGPRSILPANLTPSEVNNLDIRNVRSVEEDRYGGELREYYLDFTSFAFDLRIGRQIVRWGVVEGSRVNDTINPLDFSEMILRDIDDRYVPLKMVKADLYISDTNLEVLFIPELTFHNPAPPGSHWEQLQFFPGRETPEENLKNSEYAIKLTQLLGSFSVAASYFYTWDDFPTSFRTISNLGEFEGTSIEFMQRYKRVKSYGFTFSGDIMEQPFGLEAAYLTGKHFGTRLDGTKLSGSAKESLTGGAVERAYYKYAAGVDFLVFGADTSFQFIQQVIPDYDLTLNLVPEKIETIWALSVRKKIYYQTIFPSLLVLYFQNDQDVLLRPKVEFTVGEHTQVAIGADIFEGRVADRKNGQLLPGEFHFVGFFDNNDRVYMDVKYLF